MAYIPLPPPPIGEPQDSALWTDWYNKMSAGPVSVISSDLGDIDAGSIRGVNVNAASHTTVGSYLTIGSAAAATTLSVRNTSDFSSSGGTGVIIDSLNDRDSFTYTGKTSSTLTGCSGILAHNVNATVFPLQKVIVIDAATNEMRFYGDRGDGVIDELASIGTTSSVDAIGTFGTSQTTRIGIYGRSSNTNGVFGKSTSSAGVSGQGDTGVQGISNDLGQFGGQFTSPVGVGCDGRSGTGNGGQFWGNATRGNLMLPRRTTNPTDVTADQFANINGKLCYSDGTNWRRVSDDVIV